MLTKKIIAIATLLCLVSAVSQAQEAVSDAERDKCVKEEQMTGAAKGAGMGALAGVGAAILSGGNKQDAVKKVAAGAVVGGTAGFAMAYYGAIDACNKKNPAWITESKIERTKDYARVKRDTKYQSKEGIKAEATKLDIPTSVKPGAVLDLVSTFYALTPKGEETTVALSRKWFAIEDDKETALPYSGKGTEERTIEPGEHKDTGRISISADAKPGSKYRYEFSVSVDGKPASSVTKTVVVQ